MKLRHKLFPLILHPIPFLPYRIDVVGEGENEVKRGEKLGVGGVVKLEGVHLFSFLNRLVNNLITVIGDKELILSEISLGGGEGWGTSFIKDIYGNDWVFFWEIDKEDVEAEGDYA